MRGGEGDSVSEPSEIAKSREVKVWKGYEIWKYRTCTARSDSESRD
jgi:hypothetical protein